MYFCTLGYIRSTGRNAMAHVIKALEQVLRARIANKEERSWLTSLGRAGNPPQNGVYSMSVSERHTHESWLPSLSSSPTNSSTHIALEEIRMAPAQPYYCPAGFMESQAVGRGLEGLTIWGFDRLKLIRKVCTLGNTFSTFTVTHTWLFKQSRRPFQYPSWVANRHSMGNLCVLGIIQIERYCFTLMALVYSAQIASWEQLVYRNSKNIQSCALVEFRMYVYLKPKTQNPKCVYVGVCMCICTSKVNHGHQTGQNKREKHWL